MTKTMTKLIHLQRFLLGGFMTESIDSFKKILTAFILSLTLLTLPLTATAEEKFPSKPINIIVPYSVGGGVDTWSRIFSLALSSKKSLRQPINVKNISGASGLRGTMTVYNAKPDGYTLISFANPSEAWAWYVNKPNFDITKLVGIGVFANEPNVLITHSDSDINSYTELETAYNNGSKKIIAGLQKGGNIHIISVLLKQRNKLNWSKYISYKGTANVVSAIIRKEVEFGIVSATAAMDGIANGKLKALAVLGVDKRLQSYPNTPTLNEFGLNPLTDSAVTSRSFFAPPGLPAGRQKILQDAIMKAQQNNKFLQAQYNSIKLQPAMGDGKSAEQALQNAIAVAEEVNLIKLLEK